jgi:hypothetical protein
VASRSPAGTIGSLLLRLPRTHVLGYYLPPLRGCFLLAVHAFGEHFFGVDGDEDAAAAGEDFVFVVEDLGGVDVGAAALFDFASFDAQRLVQRDGLEILDGHFAREGDDVMEFIYLAHGVVEDAGDDAAVAMAGRSGIALAEAEAADKGLAGFVEGELETHAAGIVHAADKAIVFLELHVAGFVALGLAGHGRDSTAGGRC